MRIRLCVGPLAEWSGAVPIIIAREMNGATNEEEAVIAWLADADHESMAQSLVLQNTKAWVGMAEVLLRVYARETRETTR
jgi:hypothetical protein